MSKPTCVEPDCEKASHARGLCGPHYSKHYKLGTLPPLPPKPTGCSRTGCNRGHYLRGLCRFHYEKVREARAECSAEGCTRGTRTKGLCGAHYQILRREWQPDCSAPECDQKANSGGLCNRHYKQAKREASPPCSVEWCNNNSTMMGYCNTHHAQVWRIGAVIPDEVACVMCGEIFSRSQWKIPGSGIRCPECQVKAGARRWCMTVEELAERDGLVCSICGEGVDLALRRPDLMSPSVEHIIPRARGGADVPENLALAHLICNLRKGAKAA